MSTVFRGVPCVKHRGGNSPFRIAHDRSEGSVQASWSSPPICLRPRLEPTAPDDALEATIAIRGRESPPLPDKASGA